MILNEKSEWYTYSVPGECSDIDVTLCTNSFHTMVAGWEVLGDHGLSDHNLVVICLNYGAVREAPLMLHRNKWRINEND